MSELNEKVEEPQEQPSDRAPMPDEELQKILEAHRMWVESEGKEGERAALGGANLQEAVLRGANLQKAHLREANLQKAHLREANLEGANLFEAKLQGAKLTGANLQEANLFGANLEGAVLGGANLQKARLFGANLQGAVLGGAKALNSTQVKTAVNWELAFYSKDFLKELGLSPDHNEPVKKKLAELEKEKKATGAKP